MANDNDTGVLNRADEFLQMFKKGAEFTQELLRENERLRYTIVQLQEAVPRDIHAGGSGEEATVLLRRIEQLEQEKAEIMERIRQVEAENQDFAARYVEIEAENNNLANLYIASYQLHSTLDFREVLQIIIEIIINLIGAEEFAVMILDEKICELRAVASEGVTCEELPVVRLGDGIIGEQARTGDNYFVKDVAAYHRDFLNPMVCIPLKIKERVIGVIVIYTLLVQKKEFAPVDYELFTLLAGHAATAIFSAKLYSESERKLSTIQSFIGLLSS
jgi:GAF domain-containing protein